MPFVVEIIEYEDDYKHRFDSGVYPRIEGIYSTQEKTDEVVLKIKLEYIDENLKERDEDDVEEIANYVRKSKKTGDMKLKNRYRNNNLAIEEVFDKMNSWVEYVDCDMEINVYEMEMDI